MTDQPTPGTAVEPGIVPGFGDDLEPAVKRHLAALHKEARQLALTSVVPKSITHRREKVGNEWQDVPNPIGQVVATVYSVVRYGEVFGFPPAVALSKVDVIEGRMEPRYDALLGIVMAHGHQVRWLEQSREQAVIRVRRAEDRDDPDAWQVFSFTDEDARQAGSVKDNPSEREAKGAWYTRRIDMLASKAAKRMVRMACPDVLVQLGVPHGGDALEMPVDAYALDDEVADGEVA